MRAVIARFVLSGLVCCLLVLSSLGNGAGSNSPAVTELSSNSQDTLRAYLQLQEQIHITQLAIERNRQATEAEAARNAEATSNRLAAIELFLSGQREHEQEAIRSNNKTVLIAAGVFAVLGFAGMLFTAWLQWRAANRFSDLTASSHMTRALLPGWPQLLPGGEPPASAGAAPVATPAMTAANERFIETINLLEKRIKALEHTADPVFDADANGTETATNGTHISAGEPASDALPGDQAARITLLLGKGQSLLNMDQTEEAVACFDEVLGLDNNNTDALVKKGVALERQRKLEEAIECYDRAIAADNSITIAYLYKGGIYNRLERFSEALECYEKALHTQEKQHA
jgi:tetratricopeptide (TPR) repeat protein